MRCSCKCSSGCGKENPGRTRDEPAGAAGGGSWAWGTASPPSSDEFAGILQAEEFIDPALQPLGPTVGGGVREEAPPGPQLDAVPDQPVLLGATALGDDLLRHNLITHYLAPLVAHPR